MRLPGVTLSIKPLSTGAKRSGVVLLAIIFLLGLNLGPIRYVTLVFDSVLVSGLVLLAIIFLLGLNLGPIRYVTLVFDTVLVSGLVLLAIIFLLGLNLGPIRYVTCGIKFNPILLIATIIVLFLF